MRRSPVHVPHITEVQRELRFEILFASVAAGGDSSEVCADPCNVEFGGKLQKTLGVDSILEPGVGHAEDVHGQEFFGVGNWDLACAAKVDPAGTIDDF